MVITGPQPNLQTLS